MRWSWAVVLGAWSALACAGGIPSPSGTVERGNRAACEAYVERVNALGPCVQVTYDPSNLCEGAAALPPEMAAFYDCLRTSSRCDGGSALIGEGCTAPMVALVDPRKGPVDVTMDPGRKEDR